MADKTGIQWTDASWNPIRGCSRVSEGCRNCYAETVANRFKGPGMPYEGLIARGGQWNGEIKLVPKVLDQPLRWTKPRRIFVNSMSDLFHENVPDEYIDKVFAVMALSPDHTFQVLTKRPERMLAWFSERWQGTVAMPELGIPAGKPTGRVHEVEQAMMDIAEAKGLLDPDNDALWNEKGGSKVLAAFRWPLPNVWIGVSIEDQATADERIPLLLQTPAAVRWVSAEPLLGPVDIYNGDPDPRLAGVVAGPGLSLEQYWKADGTGPFPGVDWVVAGGESGTGARPMHPDWARSLRDQCAAAGTPFFFKQWGEYAPNWFNDEGGNKIPDTEWMDQQGKKKAGRLLDGRTHDEYPEV